MSKFYSKTTGGFYDQSIHGSNIPVDSVEISDEDHLALLNGQSSGMLIAPGEDGFPILVDPPAPSKDQIIAGLVASVQRHLDEMAKGYGYDDIKSAVTYADEPAVAKFQNEGRAFRAWRSLVWEKCYEIRDAVSAGNLAVPTENELIDALPELELP